MTPDNFCYWLQGFFEIAEGEIEELSPEQIQMIKTHLKYVFDEKTRQQSSYSSLLGSPSVAFC